MTRLIRFHDEPSKHPVAVARRRRASPTAAEALLWRFLRQSAMHYKFRRQHPIQGEIVDFYSPRLKLAIEVRDHRESRSANGDGTLEAAGIRILVLRAGDLLHALARAKREVVEAVARRARQLEVLPKDVQRCLGLTDSGLFCVNRLPCAKRHRRWLFTGGSDAGCG